MWFIGVEVEQETSAPPLEKILDPPLRFINKLSFETWLLIKLKRKAARSERIEYISQFSLILLTSRFLKWQLRYFPCQFPSLQHRNLLRLGPRSSYELQQQDINLFVHKSDKDKENTSHFIEDSSLWRYFAEAEASPIRTETLPSTSTLKR